MRLQEEMRVVKIIGTESRILVTRGSGERHCCFMGIELQLGKMEKTHGEDGGHGAQEHKSISYK